MKTFNQLINECRETVHEIFPWDLNELMDNDTPMLLLDVREADEFNAMHIRDSFHVPRGILETACEFGFAETVPELAGDKNQKIVVICRSGNRSLLAAESLMTLGFKNVYSLQTGLRGWNDYELPLYDIYDVPVDMDFADAFFSPTITTSQMGGI